MSDVGRYKIQGYNMINLSCSLTGKESYIYTLITLTYL